MSGSTLSLPKEPLLDATQVKAALWGSTSSLADVTVTINYYNAGGVKLGSEAQLVQSGSLGVFSVETDFFNSPPGSVEFDTDIQVAAGLGILIGAWAIPWGCSGCPGTGSGGSEPIDTVDTGAPEDPETPPSTCSVTCIDRNGDDYEIHGIYEGGQCTKSEDDCPDYGECPPDEPDPSELAQVL